MEVDWSATAALIGALGGLSGFASLGATWWWRRQDRRKLEVERVSVERVSRGAHGLSFWVRYTGAPSSESLKAEIRLLSGGRAGPYIERFVQTPYDPRTSTVEQVPPIGTARKLDIRLGNYTDTPHDVRSAWVILHGSPQPTAAKVRIKVRGEASGVLVTTRVLHVAP